MHSEAVSSRPAGARGQVDHTALRTNQAFIIALLALAFLADQPWLVAFVCAVMALGTAIPQAALFQRVYRDILRPAGLLRPDLRAEDPAPHRFAQGMGAAVLLAASLALFAGATTLGWALAFVVIVLAAVNLFFGFCAGCFVYFQLARLRG
ncbi:MAG TPA: DUF4395 domain-containing protein [Kouleothrix sp.]|mgnify:CR=1 FL=1|uniref:DUF4395 domain-containing protein n=1 Tax=Kouleothrix sp. TaxID=2779161 RepID=UPI002BAF4017|nr:DUF4395 domain-containing protein [Kouleothrix sp.]HRC77571.1 DUF4395 domain-containing protein [Kouleothrix sp.]